MARRRNRNVLGRYGFPSERDLIAQALGLAKASVPTAASIRRQYGRASRDVGGFSDALVSLLRGESGAPGAAYDPSIQEAKAANEAAVQRLSALGPEFAGAGVAAGAQGDAALSELLANRASAAEYGAKQPGIAAGRGALARIGLKNAQLDAMRQRDDALRSAFTQAYDQVRQRALAEAAASADIVGSNRAFREGRREFNVDAALRQAGLAQDQAGQAAGDQKDRQGAFYSARSSARDDARDLFEGKTVKVYDKTQGVYVEKVQRPSWDKAYDRLWSEYAPELLHLHGVSRRQVNRMIRQALIDAGFKKPKHRGPEGSGGSHVGADLLPH